MPPDHERHFKKPPKKPWVLELTLTWSKDRNYMSGKVSVWKYRYATEKAAKQAEPMQRRFWEKYKVPVTSTIYKK
jgi:hypothetical protein